MKAITQLYLKKGEFAGDVSICPGFKSGPRYHRHARDNSLSFPDEFEVFQLADVLKTVFRNIRGFPSLYAILLRYFEIPWSRLSSSTRQSPKLKVQAQIPSRNGQRGTAPVRKDTFDDDDNDDNNLGFFFSQILIIIDDEDEELSKFLLSN